MREKGFLEVIIVFLLAIFLLLAIGIGFFIFKTTQSETEQRKKETTATKVEKSYTNSKYGYTVAISQGWTYREFPDTQSGIALRPEDTPNDYQSEFITVNVMQKPANYRTMPFDDYVKIAAVQEIQGYTKLVSFKEITTQSGIVGYETTWQVTPPPGAEEEQQRISEPITYFPLPNDAKVTVQISLTNAAYVSSYEALLPTFSYIQK